MTYARLLLPDLLPDVDQVIYSDVDIIWLADVAELWEGLLPTAVLHYVKDTILGQSVAETEWLAANHLQIENRFCAGMIVMNLSIFREERLGRKMLDMLDDHDGHIPDNDETVLNVFMFGRKDVVPLPRRWQCVSRGLDDFTDRGFVLHFADDTPWRSLHAVHHMLTDQILLWHTIHAQARQTSTWKSLRQFHSVFDVIFCRTLYLCAVNCSLVRILLRFLLKLRGHSGGISCLNQFMVKFPDCKTCLKLNFN